MFISIVFDFYRISNEPSFMKLTKMVVILSSYFSKNLGKKATFSMTLMIASLMGTALEVWEFISKVITRLSLQLEQTEFNVFLTSYEMNEFASRVFFKSLANSESKSVSSIFFTLFDS